MGMEANVELSKRQEQALERVTGLPVPPAPPISKAVLIRVPGWYRAAPAFGALLFAILLVSVVFISFPLSESGSRLMLSEGRQTIHLPVGGTTLILQSPADLRIEKMRRRFLSGRLEAELVLGKGELFLEADPKAPKLILIRTPFLQARITGTQLLMGHQPETGSRLVVLRGKVQAKTTPGGWELVPAGEELTVGPDRTVVRRPIRPAFMLQAPGARAPGTDRSSRDSEPVSPDDSRMLRRVIWHEQE